MNRKSPASEILKLIVTNSEMNNNNNQKIFELFKEFTNNRKLNTKEINVILAFLEKQGERLNQEMKDLDKLIEQIKGTTSTKPDIFELFEEFTKKMMR